MCLAIPMRVVEKKDNEGKVEAGGMFYTVNFSLLPDVKVDDYVLIHAGFAIQRLDKEDADETLALFKEMDEKEW